MKRFELIEKTLSGLPNSPEFNSSNRSLQNCGVSRSTLDNLIECLTYIIFPKYSVPPRRVGSMSTEYMDNDTFFHRIIGHIADILFSQIYSAYLLEGRTERSEEGTYNPVDVKSGEAPKEASAVLSPLHSPKTAILSDSFRRDARRLSKKITEQFLTEKLSHVSSLVRSDADAICARDVASTSYSEVVLCYPGLRCMVHQRTAHALYKLGAPNTFTRLLTEMAHSATGIDIHPSTSIGHHFFIDHGTGVVIGATAIIGNHVSIYQGVTLGAMRFKREKATGALIRSVPRHPIIQDNVTIYANAVILGRVTIGAGSIIGGNCWVVRSLPPRSVITQKQNKGLNEDEKFLHNNSSRL